MRLAARILLGTTVYAMIIVFAAQLPTAAGLMITFPALNGLAFYYSPQRSLAPMTATMLWMPLINGLLCTAYVLLFLAFGDTAPGIAALVLVVAVTLAWVFVVRLDLVRLGITSRHQLAYAIAITLGGIALVLIATRLVDAPAATSATGGLLEVLRTNGWKIGMFAAILCGFLLASSSPALPDHIRGILAGLPLIPFGGLVGIAADGATSLETRRAIFQAMATTIWLSPAFAIWFIWGLSVVYGRPTADATPLPAPTRFAVLLLAWVLCLAAVLAASRLLTRA